LENLAAKKRLRDVKRKELRIHLARRLNKAKGSFTPPIEHIEDVADEIKNSISRNKGKRITSYQEGKCLRYGHIIREVYIWDNKLYQVMSISYINPSKGYMCIALRQDDRDLGGVIDRANLDHRGLEGEEGVIELIRLTKLNRGEVDIWPSSWEEWVDHQSKDDELVVLKTLIENSERGFVAKCRSGVEIEDDNFFIDEDDKIIKRRHNVQQKLEHNNSFVVKITQCIQILVPGHLVKDCLVLHHEKNGHPGRNRTTKAIKQRYYWGAVNNDAQTHVKDCHHCLARKADTHRTESLP
jgi:hypothetical protein